MTDYTVHLLMQTVRQVLSQAHRCMSFLSFLSPREGIGVQVYKDLESVCFKLNRLSEYSADFCNHWIDVIT